MDCERRRLNHLAASSSSLDALLRQLSDPVNAFEYRHQGSLAYVGEYAAISDFTRADGGTLLGKMLGELCKCSLLTACAFGKQIRSSRIL